VLLVGVAGGWAAPGLFQSSAIVLSHKSKPAQVTAVAAKPAAIDHAFMKIVPAEVDAPATEFIGTGDHSAGVWVK
jgi:hypothetical protein